jgi:hypothetical protein
MKQFLFFLMLILGTTVALNAQKKDIRLNFFSNYVFEDHVDSYYSTTSYYSGTIQAGYQWGLSAEFMVRPSKAIELKYLQQNTTAPIEYYDGSVKTKNFDLGISYLLIGGTNYFPTHGGKAEPYLGFGLGAAFINLKNPTTSSSGSGTKFAWNLKGGTNVWLSPKVGIKLQAELLSAVQAVGGSVYFGTGGGGAGVASYSTMLQFGLGGGLTFKIGN